MITRRASRLLGGRLIGGLAALALLPLADGVGADRFLELEDQSGADGLDDGRGAPFLAVLGVLGMTPV